MESTLVQTAEAAYIAGLTDRQMNRVVDERLVPEELFVQSGTTRQFSLLCVAFAHFYYFTEDVLQATARKEVLEELTARATTFDCKYLDLGRSHHIEHTFQKCDWKVVRDSVTVDVTPHVNLVLLRWKELDEATALVSTDDGVMNGTPVFAGTRVPIDIILASLKEGVGLDRLQASYPFLTEAHVQAAKVYEQVHPRRGRPRRFAEASPTASPVSTRTIRRRT